MRKKFREMRQRTRDEAGSALVELAMVAPLFVLLLVGASEFGRLAYYAIEVSDAARAGVEYGAQSNITAVNTAGISLAAAKDAPNVPGMNAAVANSCACSNAVSSAISCTTAATACVLPNRILQYVQVNTSASVDTVFHYPGLPASYSLRGQAIMRVWQ